MIYNILYRAYCYLFVILLLHLLQLSKRDVGSILPVAHDCGNVMSIKYSSNIKDSYIYMCLLMSYLSPCYKDKAHDTATENTD